MANIYVWHTRQMVSQLFHGHFLGKDEKYTTCESHESFFHNFMNRKLSLVEFYMRYESALAQQRQNKLYANHVNEYERPELKMKLELERLMSEYYMLANFKLFQ